VLSAAYAFPCDAHSVGGARRWLAEALSKWRMEPAVIDTAVLLVSELATNAIIHTGSSFDVSVSVSGRRVRVSVADDSPCPPIPRPRPSPADQEGGQGLHLIQTLARAWGTDQVPADGKVVWFEVTA